MFDKPFRVYDLTNKKEILPEDEYVYFDGHIGSIADAVTGTPSKYRLFGIEGVTTPISTSGDTTQAKSSSTADTGIVVRIRGFIDNDLLIEDYEDITLSATPTTFEAGTKTFYKITHVSKSANTTGFLTLANSSGTTLVTLAPNERISRHKIMKLGLIPNAANSYRILYKRNISEMVNDFDYPFVECDNYLIWTAVAYALKYDRQEDKSAFAFQEARSALTAILNNQMSSLGPKFQHKWTTDFANAHRTR